MFCKKCEKEMKNNAFFCSECGTKVEQNEAVQINPIDATAVQSAIPGSADTSVAVKTKSNKKILIIVGAIVLFIIIIVAAFGDDSESSSTGGASIILENDNCQLGATYTFTPEIFIKKYNNIVGNDGALPSLSEWTSSDLLGDGDISYTYAFSKDIVYTIDTYQNTNVTTVLCSLSDNSIGLGILFMSGLEAAATGITDDESAGSMAQLISDKVTKEGYTSFVYKNSVITVNANENYIIMAAVSDDVLSTMDCYVISDSEF